MIELIFSIAIMGIVLLSAPMLISMASKSTSVALQQEGINEAASRINMMLTYDWDENNINVPCGGDPSILHTNGDDALKILDGTQRRRGVPPNSNSHSFNCNGVEYNATAIAQEGADIDDLDDFNNAGLVKIDLGTGGEDYIENPDTTGVQVKIATTVKYLSDTADYDKAFSYNFDFDGTAPTGTTNIKAIRVTLTSESTEKELQKEITMYAFSCNIGSYTYVRRKLP